MLLWFSIKLLFSVEFIFYWSCQRLMKIVPYSTYSRNYALTGYCNSWTKMVPLRSDDKTPFFHYCDAIYWAVLDTPLSFILSSYLLLPSLKAPLPPEPNAMHAINLAFFTVYWYWKQPLRILTIDCIHRYNRARKMNGLRRKNLRSIFFFVRVMRVNRKEFKETAECHNMLHCRWPFTEDVRNSFRHRTV